MAKGSSKTTQTPKIIVENKSMKLKMDLIGIADRKGQSLSAFIRSKLIEIRDSIPEEMRKPTTD